MISKNHADGGYHNNAQPLPDKISSFEFAYVLLLEFDRFLAVFVMLACNCQGSASGDREFR